MCTKYDVVVDAISDNSVLKGEILELIKGLSIRDINKTLLKLSSIRAELISEAYKYRAYIDIIHDELGRRAEKLEKAYRELQENLVETSYE